MKLLVIVLCLLSERYLMHAQSYQRFSWFGDYANKVSHLIEKNNWFTNPWMVLAAIVLPIVVLTAIVYCLLHSILFGLVGLVLSIVLFFYCLGPQNAFYPLTDEKEKAKTTDRVGNYFAQVNSQLFAVIFWYIIAGPVAAVAYRLIDLSQSITLVSPQAKQSVDILEWLPARLTAILYLLVGNFQRGFALFMQYILAKPEMNNTMLSACGLLAVRSTTTEEVPMHEAESLVEYSVIVLLVLIALCTLVAWL